MRELDEMREEYINRYVDKSLVFGEGSKNSRLFLIGEAPGREEEFMGRPFVGKAGKNLDEFMEIAGINRDEIYITNVVKFRPTKASPKTGGAVNRKPSPQEISEFLPLLKAELRHIKPQLVVTLGNVPLSAVTGDSKITIGNVHGSLKELEGGMRLFPLYHPAAVIYNRALRETYLKDLYALKPLIEALANN